jgi:hypothetical protein
VLASGRHPVLEVRLDEVHLRITIGVARKSRASRVSPRLVPKTASPTRSTGPIEPIRSAVASNGREAPIPAVRRAAGGRQGSTQTGPSRQREDFGVRDSNPNLAEAREDRPVWAQLKDRRVLAL